MSLSHCTPSQFPPLSSSKLCNQQFPYLKLVCLSNFLFLLDNKHRNRVLGIWSSGVGLILGHCLCIGKFSFIEGWLIVIRSIRCLPMIFIQRCHTTLPCRWVKRRRSWGFYVNSKRLCKWWLWDFQCRFRLLLRNCPPRYFSYWNPFYPHKHQSFGTIFQQIKVATPAINPPSVWFWWFYPDTTRLFVIFEF